MNTKSKTENMHVLQKNCATDDVPVGAEEKFAVAKTANSKMTDRESLDRDDQKKPVDFRYVPHGHGPCSCCGPLSE